MSVIGLHQVLDNAPDATRTFRVAFYERTSPEKVQHCVLAASLDAVIGKTQELMGLSPEYRSVVFEFPGASNPIICYRMPDGNIGCFKASSIK
jgi:hypothetical protein